MAPSHKRETRARRRTALVAGPLTVLATSAAVAVGVLGPRLLTADQTVRPEASAASSAPSASATRSAPVSRSESRAAAQRHADQVRQLRIAHEARMTRQAIRDAHVSRWTTAPLNLWSGPESSATQVGLVDEGTKVLTTGRTSGERAELVVDGRARWVTAAYLSTDRPRPPEPTRTPTPTPSDTPSPTPSEPSSPSSSSTPATTGLSTAPCPDSSVEDGLVPSAVRVYRAVCHAFPQVTTYLGYDAHGEHASGKAIDIMTSDKALGDSIASFLQSHASDLDLYDIIWWDRIWTPVRASEGWRDYGDHGSPTANHMDHVHVSTN